MSFDPEKVYPSVSVGVGSGQFVEHFDVDMDAIRNHLVNGGLSDEQIGKISINFSDQVAPRDSHTRGAINRTVGRYNRITRQVSVWPAEELAAAQFIGVESIDQKVSQQIGEHLSHELEHAVATNDPWQRRRNSLFRAKEGAKLVGFGLLACYEIGNIPILDRPIMQLAGIAIAGTLTNVVAAHPRYKHRLYQRNPEEKRCRQAETQTPEDLVTIRSRQARYNIVDLLAGFDKDELLKRLHFTLSGGWRVRQSDNKEDEATHNNDR